MSQRPVLVRVEDVSFRYDDPSGEGPGPLALDGVSVEIASGEFIGLIGQNGSGKTTLARHLNGLLRPEEGRVLVGDQDTREVEPGQLAGQVGYVFQNPDHALFLTTVRQEVAYSLGFQDLDESQRQQRIDEALEAFGLIALADRHPASLGRGTRRLVVLAAAYAMEPDLLVLDEPTGGLDRRLTGNLVGTLHDWVASGRSAVLISHDMQLVANTCERVLVLADGKLLADRSPGDLFQRAELLEQAGLRPPDVARLSRELHDLSVPLDTVSVQGFVERYCELTGCAAGEMRE